MRISKDSWHYKALTKPILFIEGMNARRVSNSLCIYFWQVMVRVLSVFGIYTVALSPIATWSILLLGVPEVNFLHGLMAFVGLFASCVYLIFALVWVVVTLFDDVLIPLIAKCPSREEKDKQPNIFTEYVKAKKQKVCPVLEFTDD